VILNSLLVAFRDDFAKYKKRLSSLLLNEVFESVIRQASGKFVYERVGMNKTQVKQALDLLVMAGLVYPVTHTAGNGIPLGAEANPKYRRIIPCDTGLFLHILGLNSAELLVADDFKTVNRGALAEIFTGLEILKGSSCYTPRQLYCWQRASCPEEKRQSNAQVDYLIQRGEEIIPIEVKAGIRGAMQSLRLFMQEKHLSRGVRTSLENFGRYENIEVYPLYAISNLTCP
jgi:predicted AAA+ superfamily ATPase